MSEYILSGLYVYPVKSLRGTLVSHWKVVETGLDFDRKWMLVDGQGKFLSQRTLAKMALINVNLTESHLILNAPGLEDLALLHQAWSGQVLSANIWGNQCIVDHVSETADEWLSDFLNQHCRLVKQKTDQLRKVDLNYGLPDDQVAFSDGFPFLLVSENSLAMLNNEMQLDLEMVRFRPNLVVTTSYPFEEDEWREISIGAIDFRLPKPCSRCVIPSINPSTAEVGDEPLPTLKRLRQWQGKLYFGQNTLHNQTGELKVGDAVKVKKVGEKQPPL